ncbi:MAG: glycosyltransferase [Solirubrobacterales bacterium]
MGETQIVHAHAAPASSAEGTGRASTVLYASLIALGIASLILLIVDLRSDAINPLATIAVVYMAGMLAYTWYVYMLAARFDRKRRNESWPAYEDELVAVLVPCLNEEPELLGRCLHSVSSAAGRKMIVLIDDGSNAETAAAMDEWSRCTGFSLVRFPENRGKREALYAAVKRLPPEVRFVVTIDSDTILDRDAIVRVVRPLKHDKVVAATGDVQLLNERSNFLTRMIASYYWIGLHLYKAAQSSINSVTCCSGCLAAYRRETLDSIIDAFANQRFLGKACTHSEDRHLTNLCLKDGNSVVFVPDAISITETPDTVRRFVRQQMRWKRGYMRESIFTLTHAWRRKRLLFMQVALWELTEPFVTLGLRIGVVLMIFTHASVFVFALLPIWLFVGVVRNVLLVASVPEKLPGMLGYMLFYEVVLYWVNVWALLTVSKSGWLTRGGNEEPQVYEAAVPAAL